MPPIMCNILKSERFFILKIPSAEGRKPIPALEGTVLL